MATLCLVNIRCIFSVNEWTYGTVTTPLDFSCALSFLDNDEFLQEVTFSKTQLGDILHIYNYLVYISF